MFRARAIALPVALVLIATSSAFAGEDRALSSAIAEEMERSANAANSPGLLKAAWALSRLGDPHCALTLFEVCERRGLHPYSAAPAIAPSFAYGLAMRGSPNEDIAGILASIDSAEHYRILMEVSAAQTARGQHDSARDTLRLAADSALRITTSWLQAIALSDLALLASEMRAEDVKAILGGAQRAAAAEEDRERSSIAFALVGVTACMLEEAHYIDLLRRSSELLDSVRDPWKRDRALAVLALSHAIVGDDLSADRYARAIQSRNGRLSALSGIAQVQLERGNAEGALATLESVGREGEATTIEAIRVLVRAGQVEVAKEVARDRLSESRRLECYLLMAADLAGTGHRSAARRLVEEIDYARWTTPRGSAFRHDDPKTWGLPAKVVAPHAGSVAQEQSEEGARLAAAAVTFQLCSGTCTDLRFEGAQLMANASLLEGVTGALATHGDVDRAVSLIESLPNPVWAHAHEDGEAHVRFAASLRLYMLLRVAEVVVMRQETASSFRLRQCMLRRVLRGTGAGPIGTCAHCFFLRGREVPHPPW